MLAIGDNCIDIVIFFSPLWLFGKPLIFSFMDHRHSRDFNAFFHAFLICLAAIL